jgi:hypothetical protein
VKGYFSELFSAEFWKIVFGLLGNSPEINSRLKGSRNTV